MSNARVPTGTNTQELTAENAHETLAAARLDLTKLEMAKTQAEMTISAAQRLLKTQGKGKVQLAYERLQGANAALSQAEQAQTRASQDVSRARQEVSKAQADYNRILTRARAEAA